MRGHLRRVALIVALAVLVIVLLVRFPSQQSGVPVSSAGVVDAATEPGTNDVLADFRLERLEQGDTAEPEIERDLFLFGPIRPARTPGGLVEPTRAEAPPPPAGPPPPPPIPLRFIGYVEPRSGPSRLAVFSDGRGNVFDGQEGDIIEGRYRLLRVGADSADLAYVDGRGRQTIRLSGQ